MAKVVNEILAERAEAEDGRYIAVQVDEDQKVHLSAEGRYTTQCGVELPETAATYRVNPDKVKLADTCDHCYPKEN